MLQLAMFANILMSNGMAEMKQFNFDFAFWLVVS